jgi:CRP/FNR family transcriptional regulator, cyclic AMP receptor protein
MEPMDALSALERSTDLAVADRSTLERLAARMVPGDWPADTVMLSEGDPPGPCYLVQSGWVRLTSARVDRGSQLLARIGPGELVGEMTALLNRTRTATATTTEPVSAWTIPADALQAAFREDLELSHTMMLRVMELLVDRDVRMVRRLGVLPVQHIARVILDQQRAERVAVGEPLSLTRADLEAITGEPAIACVMNLARLERAGAVETRGEQLVVLDLERLHQLAE